MPVQNLRESAVIIAEKTGYGFEWVRIKFARNFQSTLRGIHMSLATVAYRISSDDSFVLMLQQCPEEVLQSAGIFLTKEEEVALQKVLSVPGMLNSLLDQVLKAEPWIYCA